MTYEQMDTLPAWEPMERGENGLPVHGKSLPMWSNDSPPPAIGDRVRVIVNNIGDATVQGYFVQDDFLGIIVLPLDPPEWFIRQNGKDSICHAFGAELEL